MVPAPEVLWSILASCRLRAKKGKGMYEKAVCFSEKPLVALKDTVMGAEARVRRGTRSLVWSAYGIMFEKTYLQSLGVRPVLHLDDQERLSCPKEMAHRIISFKEGTNWLHEREWRGATDLVFDITQCIVLVPNFEQAEIFRAALAEKGKRARGILPLHDLFAAL